MTGRELQQAFDEEGARHVFTGLAADIRRRQRAQRRFADWWRKAEPLGFLLYGLLFIAAAGGMFTPVIVALAEGRHP